MSIGQRLVLASNLFLFSLYAAAAPSPLTPQTAEYQVYYGSIELGKARFQLPKAEGNIYHYRFDSDVSLLVLSDRRNVRSDFIREGNQLTPMRYTHNRKGTGPNFQEQAAFAKAQAVVYSSYKDERSKLDYTHTLYDPLMVQLQFRLDIALGKKELHYEMVKEGEVDEYTFKIVGKERVNIESGSYETIKVEVVRDSKKRQTFFWMAPDLGYLPIRLTHFEKGSKQLDIKLLNYHFSPEQTVKIEEPAADSSVQP
ncbi:DUF3108 domain-containing protein [Shewanella violacea]|uniref:DUF3108 domain-containing protein n=1 Tax=Shewanella violacea (strain JCM 10179 / CIP 106290 / LMG 19151 / DSS12) TaxID=637905 RepID=D4ZL01_SHEVD|nr:DUF3108 domain-containing protein [Shewanella violacea]BAJ02350.1 conserved hypothetical protein [Shewanella violacea DSS12]